MQVPYPDYNRSGSLGSLELRQTERTEFIGQAVSYAEADMGAVAVLSVDSLALPRLDFLKIDVEGMELDVLEGAKATLEREKPTLLIEWIKSGKAEIRDFLTPMGYRLVELSMNILARADR
jgi:FkbM family methyltransferase